MYSRDNYGQEKYRKHLLSYCVLYLFGRHSDLLKNLKARPVLKPLGNLLVIYNHHGCRKKQRAQKQAYKEKPSVHCKKVLALFACKLYLHHTVFKRLTTHIFLKLFGKKLGIACVFAAVYSDRGVIHIGIYRVFDFFKGDSIYGKAVTRNPACNNTAARRKAIDNGGFIVFTQYVYGFGVKAAPVYRACNRFAVFYIVNPAGAL